MRTRDSIKKDELIAFSPLSALKGGGAQAVGHESDVH